MKKIVVVIGILGSMLLSWGAMEKVQINAKQFDSDELSGKSIFTGNVVVTKKNDRLNADKAIVTTDKKNQPEKFEFFGAPVTFLIVQDINKSYKGHANNVVYLPNTKEYILTESAYVEYIEEGKKVYGDRIVINQLENKAQVTGKTNKPAVFIFHVEEKGTK